MILTRRLSYSLVGAATSWRQDPFRRILFRGHGSPALALGVALALGPRRGSLQYRGGSYGAMEAQPDQPVWAPLTTRGGGLVNLLWKPRLPSLWRNCLYRHHQEAVPMVQEP